MKYSIGFRNGVLKKVLPPESRPVKVVASENGISEQTIRNWMAMAKNGTLDISTGETAPGDRDNAEKLRLVLESKTIPADCIGHWLRERGLHSEHLPLWEQELLHTMNDKTNTHKVHNSELLKENKKLKKELARKEKALAEMAALLILKKKADEIWGVSEDD